MSDPSTGLRFIEDLARHLGREPPPDETSWMTGLAPVQLVELATWVQQLLEL